VRRAGGSATTKAALFDAIGAQAVIELRDETHQGYMVMAARIREWLASEIEQVTRTPLDAEKTAWKRGAIEALEKVLAMPNELIKEFNRK
jgi:hypothetical protein